MELLFFFYKNNLKMKFNENIGIKDRQCNIIEELKYMRESYLEANLDKREICTMLEMYPLYKCLIYRLLQLYKYL